MKSERQNYVELVAMGLVDDIGEKEALSFLSIYHMEDLIQYFSRYGVVTTEGKLLFVPGTTFSMIKRDVLFDKEIQMLVISSCSILKVDIVKKLNYLSGTYDPALGKKSLEDIWYDFNTVYPESIKKGLCAQYGIKEDSFSSVLYLIGYSYERAQENRKLIDHVFLDGEERSCRTMIAKIILSNEKLINYSIYPLRITSYDKLLSLVDAYKIDPLRVGKN